MRGDIWGKVFGGLVLIAVGVVFLLNQLGVWSVDIGYLFSHYWPVILIMFGLKGILIQRRLDYGWGGSYLWNLVVVVLGLVFLNNNLGWVDRIGFDDIFKFFVPLILIVLGLNMLFRPRKKQSKKEPEWANPMESPFKPYSSYEPPAEGKPENPVTPPAPPTWNEPLHQTPKPPHDPFEHAAKTDPKEAWTNEIPEKPAYVKDWVVWKEQFKKDWRGSMRERRKEWHDRHNHHGHHDPFDDSRSKGANGDGVQHRHNFIGDLHVGQDYWELRSMNISHFIGDTELDLTRAVIPYGETKINISAFIGDVKVYVPNDVQLEVAVTASSFLGDINVFERREGGMFRSMQSASTGFKEAEKRVRIVVSMFIGDVRVKRVG